MLYVCKAMRNIMAIEKVSGRQNILIHYCYAEANYQPKEDYPLKNLGIPSPNSVRVMCDCIDCHSARPQSVQSLKPDCPRFIGNQ